MALTSNDELVFQLLFKALENNKSIHLNIVWATIGLQVAAIGWLISSEQARNFISHAKRLKVASLSTILIIAFAHYFMIFDTVTTSSEVIRAIEENHHFIALSENSPNILSYYSLNTNKVIARAAFTFILFFYLCVLVCTAKNITKRSSGRGRATSA
ncbi:hypothetical protein [Microbulbifer epialgicus]|uniref:Uncharacterized protein n=1 Tax=Microbulbifer epialgicus TaxID=393907 RepID=A0ABV4P0E6_9GAMM